MARDTEQLVVSLEARVRDFERNFQRANKTANDNFSRIEKRAKQSGDRMEKSLSGAASRVGSTLKNFGAGFAGGILGGLSVAGLQRIAGAVKDVAKSVAMIGSNAKMAGLTTKAFQELGYVAEQSRINVDTLADGMKELQLRADEFITTGSGSGADSFKRLGYSATELKEKLKDPSALLVDIIARLQQLDKAAQIRIADELFGGQAGERFVELLDHGADGIRKMIKEAHDFGLVLSDDVIAHADEIDRKFNLISKTIGTRMKGAIVSAASELLGFMDKMKDLEERQSTTLTGQLADIGKRRMDNENQILKLKDTKENTVSGTLFGGAIDTQIAALEKENAELGEKEQRILKVLDDRDRKAEADAKAAQDAVPDIKTLNTTTKDTKSSAEAGAKGLTTYADAIRALQDEIPELTQQLRELDARTKIEAAYRAAIQKATSIGQVNQAYALRQQALAAIGKDIPAKGGDNDPSEDARRKAQEQIDAYADIVAGAQDFITSQQQEATALGMSAEAAAAYRYEQEMLNQAKRDNIELSADQRREITQYAQGMAHAERATQQLAQSQEDAAELSRFFGESAIDALTGIASGSMTAMDALRQLIAALARMALQAAFLGEGPLAGSLKGTGGLFGSIGRRLSSSTSPAAVSAGTGSPMQAVARAQTLNTDQTYAAPVEKVERAPLPPVGTPDLGLRGTLGIDGANIAKTVQPVMQDATKQFAKSISLTPREVTDLKKTLMTEWVPKQGDMQGKGIIDTILNRKASGKWGDTIGEVVSARKQFSAINGGIPWTKGRIARGIDDIPDSVLAHGRGKLASDLVDSYLPERAAGASSSVGDHLNYANRAHSTPNNFAWIDKLQGPKFGGHQHGTTADLQRWRPGEFGVQLPGQDPNNPMNLRPKETVPPGLDMAKQAQDQQQAIQEQIEAQQRLAQQMQATQQATQSMQQPIQGIGQAATQVVPNLGGMSQGVTGLIGPLTQAVPGLGQFGGAITQLLQQLMSAPTGGAGIFGSLLGLAGGGEVRGPGTSTSDSIPTMLSDGEFVVNAKATKRHRAALEAINGGKTLALASGGFVGRNSFANTYAPSLSINVASSGDRRQDARLADRIADRVGQALPQDPFRRSESQKLAQQAGKLQRAGSRNG